MTNSCTTPTYNDDGVRLIDVDSAINACEKEMGRYMEDVWNDAPDSEHISDTERLRLLKDAFTTFYAMKIVQLTKGA